MMQGLKIYKDIDMLINSLADAICKSAQKSIGARGVFNFVLSGGSSPERLYNLLSSTEFKSKIDWGKTYFFFGDERFVPESDSRRNSLMAKKALFEPLKIPDTQIFSVDTDHMPKESAEQYAARIISHFQKKPVEFDFILLGLGDNAHTASLFPYSTILEETEATVKSIFIKEVNMYRVSMTAALINQSRQIAFLVFGQDKAEAVFHILKDKAGSATQYPARLINSNKGETIWYLDEDAASLL